MAEQFKLPDLGEDVDEAEVIGILVSVGETVEPEQGIIEIETDKANVEVPAPTPGTITEIHVKVGDKIKTGQLLATVEAPAAAPTAPQPAAALQQTAPPVPAAAQPAPPATEEAPAAPAPAVAEPAPTPEPPTAAAPAAAPQPAAAAASSAPVPAPSAAPTTDGPHTLAPAAPSVRQFAREVGIDVDSVPGSGPGGRVSIDDVKLHARTHGRNGGDGGNGGNGAAAGAPMAAQPAPASQPLPDFTRYGEVRRERMNGVRRTVAREMWQSWTQIPLVTLYQKADITDLDAVRRRHRDSVAQQGGNLTLLPILMKIVATGLKQFPRMAASVDLDAQELVYKEFVHIGFAADTDRGLLVPVVRDVDQKTITEISIEIVRLSEQARDGKLALEDMRGPTFTISNLGGMGTGFFTPLIHAPESAILGVGRGEMEPVWIDGEFQPRMRMPLSLSHDHRVSDGADGARFLNWLVQAIQDPLLISL